MPRAELPAERVTDTPSTSTQRPQTPPRLQRKSAKFRVPRVKIPAPRSNRPVLVCFSCSWSIDVVCRQVCRVIHPLRRWPGVSRAVRRGLFFRDHRRPTCRRLLGTCYRALKRSEDTRQRAPRPRPFRHALKRPEEMREHMPTLVIVGIPRQGLHPFEQRVDAGFAGFLGFGDHEAPPFAATAACTPASVRLNWSYSVSRWPRPLVVREASSPPAALRRTMHTGFELPG